MKQVVAGAMLVGGGLAGLWMFIKIKVEGSWFVFEPVEWILAVEAMVCMGFIVYGLVMINGQKGGERVVKAWSLQCGHCERGRMWRDQQTRATWKCDECGTRIQYTGGGSSGQACSDAGSLATECSL